MSTDSQVNGKQGLVSYHGRCECQVFKLHQNPMNTCNALKGISLYTR